MIRAIQQVRDGISITAAARNNGVPRRTLGDRYDKIIPEDIKTGARCKLYRLLEKGRRQKGRCN